MPKLTREIARARTSTLSAPRAADALCAGHSGAGWLGALVMVGAAGLEPATPSFEG